MMGIVPVSSQAIAAVGYDPSTKAARVVFVNGRVHDYPGVTAEQHQEFLEADSIGRHFNQHFRGRKHARVA